MAKGSKLREALDRYQGKDRSREHKLDVQKKQQKDADKKRKSKTADEVLGAASDAALEAGALDADMVDGEEGWEDASEDEEDGSEDEEDSDEEESYDLSRILEDESDSDSDDDADEEDVEDEEERQNIASAKAVLKSLKSTLSQSQPATTTSKSIANSTSAKAKTAAEDSEEKEEDDDDQEDIPLSDIASDASGADDIIPHQRLTINNTAALNSALQRISLPTTSVPFSEHMTVLTTTPTTIPDINDDLNRELAFYAQSLSAVQSARALLTKENIPFTRPTDYFAEMVKSDEHMGKIKAKMLSDAASKQAAADARKQRDLKRFGKQVQQEKLKERAMQKREMLDKVKSLKRKRASEGVAGAGEEDLFDVALEDAAVTERRDRDERRQRGPGGKGGAPNAKRAKKNEKFGFGGKKRFSKSNDARTAGDMSGYSAKKMKAAKTGAAKRPGKARRANAGR